MNQLTIGWNSSEEIGILSHNVGGSRVTIDFELWFYFKNEDLTNKQMLVLGGDVGNGLKYVEVQSSLYCIRPPENLGLNLLLSAKNAGLTCISWEYTRVCRCGRYSCMTVGPSLPHETFSNCANCLVNIRNFQEDSNRLSACMLRRCKSTGNQH